MVYSAGEVSEQVRGLEQSDTATGTLALFIGLPQWNAEMRGSSNAYEKWGNVVGRIHYFATTELLAKPFAKGCDMSVRDYIVVFLNSAKTFPTICLPMIYMAALFEPGLIPWLNAYAS